MSSFETKGPVQVSIELSRGSIHLIASDRTDTVVAVNPTDPDLSADLEAARKTKVDLANGNLTIKQPKSGGIASSVIGWKDRGSVDVTVELPEGSSLRGDTGVADYTCVGLLDDVEVKTGAGGVRLDRTAQLLVRLATGHVSVGEVSGRAEIVAAGDIALGRATGNTIVKNINGRTWIGLAEDNVRVTSANGDISIDTAEKSVAAKTANGTIRIGRVARDSVTIETAAGGLEVGVKQGTSAWIDARTRFGKIHNSLSPDEDPEQADETVQVRARTSFGDILIRRSSD